MEHYIQDRQVSSRKAPSSRMTPWQLQRAIRRVMRRHCASIGSIPSGDNNTELELPYFPRLLQSGLTCPVVQISMAFVYQFPVRFVSAVERPLESVVLALTARSAGWPVVTCSPGHDLTRAAGEAKSSRLVVGGSVAAVGRAALANSEGFRVFTPTGLGG
jgi:hypothetical protein